MLDFKGYEFLPETSKTGLENYVTHKLMPGSFLMAVLSNNLFDAVNKADNEHQKQLVNIVKFLYNRVPSNCWGTREMVLDYLQGEQ